jgi:hypothetical protein
MSPPTFALLIALAIAFGFACGVVWMALSQRAAQPQPEPLTDTEADKLAAQALKLLEDARWLLDKNDDPEGAAVFAHDAAAALDRLATHDAQAGGLRESTEAEEPNT